MLVLNKIVLSKLELTTSGLCHLAKAVDQLQNLEHLDVSYNKLTAVSFKLFFKRIGGRNKLKSLNMSYNNLVENMEQQSSE